MATEVITQAVDGSPKADEDHVTQDDAPLKRKASPVDDSSSTKRLRQDDDRSPPHRRPSVDTTQDRRASASQEEKKRGKRLFGGLLNTLSQTNTNSQHKRRQEIERRQQERMQKQRDDDDQKRAEKLAKIKEARMVDQIDFEAQVMRNKHSKTLALADFLKTKTQPAIYYLPWKRTADQEDTIDEQIRSAKATIAAEEEEFKMKRERHLSRYQPRRFSHVDREDDAAGKPKVAAHADDQDGAQLEQLEQEPTKKESEQKTTHHDDPHDESGDVLVEADEDMVIY